jgi:putative ABC transport system permease protein
VNFLYLAWKNLTTRPLSTLLSCVLFALGIGLTSLLMLLSDQMTQKFERNLAGVNVVVGAKGSPLQLILCNMYHLDVPTGNIMLSAAKPFLNPRYPLFERAEPLSLGDSYKGFRIVGTLRSFPTLYNGQLETGGKMWENPFEVVLGASVAEKAGLKLGAQFQSNHGLMEDADPHAHGALKVVGILQPTGTVLDQLILTATQTIWETHAHENEAAETPEEHAEHEGEHDHAAHEEKPEAIATDDRAQLLAETDSTRQITALLIKFKVKNIQALNFQRNLNENTGMQAATPALEINRLFEMLGFGEQALRALATVIVVVSGLSIFIALFNSLKERRHELALMRVMGASRAQVLGLILLEGLILSLLGFAFGILLGHVAMQVLDHFMSGAYAHVFTGKTWLQSEWRLLAAALGVGFLAAIVPALNAYRTDISITMSRANA